jgi:hypothetical protein
MDGWNYRRMTTMPTSDADRYAQLLQNLAVRIGAIREAEAIERGARAAYWAACERWPNARITLRQGARVVEDSHR